MKSIVLRSLASAGLFMAVSSAASADSTNATKAYFEARSVDERNLALAELAGLAPNDPQAAYVHSAGLFFAALERLGQSFHRHGFESPTALLLPVMRLPVPENPNPEPLDYHGFRSILAQFHTDLSEAEAGLGAVPDDAGIAVDVDFSVFGLDFDADGQIGPQESLQSIVRALADPRRRRGPARDPRDAVPDEPPALSFRFDRADAYWLQGYASFLMATVDFWLAHDFGKTFDQSFHLFFPRARLPLQDILAPSGDRPGSVRDTGWRQTADLVSLIHLVQWQVVEPERRRASRTHLLEMIRLSRENWKAIRAETDNEREWLPGPQQPGIHPLTGLEVGEEHVKGWHEALAIAERLLEGEALLPHFRVTGQGMNLRRFFDEPLPFDLVLMITGPDAAPWLERGEIVTADEWRDVRRQFGRNSFIGFAAWFN